MGQQISTSTALPKDSESEAAPSVTVTRWAAVATGSGSVYWTVKRESTLPDVEKDVIPTDL